MSSNDTREALAAEAAWRDGWRACRDSEFVGIESENDEWASRSAGLLDRLAALTEQPAEPQGVQAEPLTKEQRMYLHQAADLLDEYGNECSRGGTDSSRNQCFVSSRAEIDGNADAEARFESLIRKPWAKHRWAAERHAIAER